MRPRLRPDGDEVVKKRKRGFQQKENGYIQKDKVECASESESISRLIRVVQSGVRKADERNGQRDWNTAKGRSQVIMKGPVKQNKRATPGQLESFRVSFAQQRYSSTHLANVLEIPHPEHKVDMFFPQR